MHSLVNSAPPRRPDVSRSSSRLVALAILFFLAGLRSLSAADAADAYPRALAAGKAQLDAGQLADALRDFQQAVQADGTQYEGYFYLAVASFRLGDHAAAEEYAGAALNAATGADQTRANELLTAIRKAKEVEELAQQADGALDQGLIAKAADLYARAFELAPDRGDLGLKGATLYANRLNRLLEAATLYHGAVASGDAAAATTAGAELGALHDRLSALYRKELPDAVAREDRTKLAWLRKAFPQESQPSFEIAAGFAKDGDGKWAVHWLREAVKRGSGYADIQARVAFLDLWEKDSPELKSFLGDAFGQDAVDDMNRRLRSRQAKQAEEKRIAAQKAEAERIAREAVLRKHQQEKELADRENASRPLRAQLRRPVVEQLKLLLETKPKQQIGEKRKGYYTSVAHDFNASFALHGDDYVLAHKQVEHGWGPKGRNGVTENVRTYILASLEQLAHPAITAHWMQEYPKYYGGPFKQLRTLKMAFGANVVSTTTQRFENRSLAESSGPYNGKEINVDFFVANPGDADRVVALFRELKAIDSLTLEQLRAKTGASP
ncbi:MAG TPA: hypothetical protein VHN79_12160 [Lacunisphaera sp.]|nr:hypothetical protein [Lacunisphaera sp.]